MAYFTQQTRKTSRPQGKEGLAENIRTQVLSEPNARGKTPTLSVIRRGIKLAKPSNAVIKALEKAVDQVNRYDGYDAVKVVMDSLAVEDAAKALKGLKEIISLTKVKDTGLITEMSQAPKGAEKKPAKKDGWSPARRAAHEAAKAAKAAGEAPKGAEDVKAEVDALTAPQQPSAKELVLMALKGQQDALKAQSEANAALHTALMAYMGD